MATASTSSAISISSPWAVLHAYSKTTYTPKHVVLLCKVIDDGLGDYHNLLQVAYAIGRVFKDCKITAICDASERRLKQIQAIEAKRKHPFITHLYKRPFGANFGLQAPPFKLRQESVEALKTCELVLQVSTPFSKHGSVAIYSKLPRHSWAYIPEYGYSGKSGDLDLEQATYVTGMGKVPYFFLNNELRDFTEKVGVEGPDKAFPLKDFSLKKHLSGNSETWLDYLKTYRLAVSYFQSPHTLTSYLHVFAGYSMEDKRDIDLIALTGQDFISQYRLCLQNIQLELLKDYGVARLLFQSLDSKTPSIEVDTGLPTKGKTVRIVNPFPIEQNALFKLLSVADRFVGARGNGTLTESWAVGALPFLEHHCYTQPILSSLTQLARSYGESKYDFLEGYYQALKLNPRDFSKKDCHELAAILRQDSLWDDHQLFLKGLWENHHFEQLLPAIIRRSYLSTQGSWRKLYELERAVLNKEKELAELEKEIKDTNT